MSTLHHAPQALSIIVRSALASQPGITLRGNCCYMPLLRTRPEEQLPGGAKVGSASQQINR